MGFIPAFYQERCIVILKAKPQKTVPSTPQKKKKGKIRENVEALVIAVLLALFIRTFVVQAFKIPSGSMQNTLLIGDQFWSINSSTGLNSRLPI